MEHQPTCAPDLPPAASAALRPFLDLVEKYTTGENALAPRLPPGCAGEVEARMGEAGVEDNGEVEGYRGRGSFDGRPYHVTIGSMSMKYRLPELFILEI